MAELSPFYSFLISKLSLIRVVPLPANSLRNFSPDCHHMAIEYIVRIF